MQCPNCGVEVAAGIKFCTHCGAKLDSETGGHLVTDNLPQGNTSYKISGTTLQVLELQLQPGQVIYSESGGMSWMSGNVDMKTHTGGGLGKLVKRAFSGESLFITDFFVNSGSGTIAFASEFPGKILPFKLEAGQSLILQKDAFMCAEKSIDLDIHFRRKLGTGFFGGEGFIMQRATGPGLVFAEVDGEVIELDLGPGQVLKVDTGHVALLEPTVDFDISMVKGFRNILLGGEGLFLAKLTGPGKVWLQTMPMMKLAQKVLQFMPKTATGRSGSGLNINLGGG